MRKPEYLVWAVLVCDDPRANPGEAKYTTYTTQDAYRVLVEIHRVIDAFGYEHAYTVTDEALVTRDVLTVRRNGDGLQLLQIQTLRACHATKQDVRDGLIALGRAIRGGARQGERKVIAAALRHLYGDDLKGYYGRCTPAEVEEIVARRCALPGVVHISLSREDVAQREWAQSERPELFEWIRSLETFGRLSPDEIADLVEHASIAHWTTEPRGLI